MPAFHNTVVSAPSLLARSTPSSTSTPAFQTSASSIHIPLIGNEPFNDPVVYICISILLFAIALAIFLLTWTQWRSSREVWASVSKAGQYRHLRNSTHFAVPSERLSWECSSQMEQGFVKICHGIALRGSEDGLDADSDADSEIDEQEAAVLDSAIISKCLRFSDPPKLPLLDFERPSPPASLDDGFEAVYDQFHCSRMIDSENADLGVASMHRSSMSERQFRELCL